MTIYMFLDHRKRLARSNIRFRSVSIRALSGSPAGARRHNGAGATLVGSGHRYRPGWHGRDVRGGRATLDPFRLDQTCRMDQRRRRDLTGTSSARFCALLIHPPGLPLRAKERLPRDCKVRRASRSQSSSTRSLSSAHVCSPRARQVTR